MGKASKWFRVLLGLRKPDPSPQPLQPSTNAKPPKRRWSFVKSCREKRPSTSVDDQRRVTYRESDEVSNHAVAVAAAKAAVAEAAIATAHSANAVVKLTSSSGWSASTSGGGVNNAVAYVSSSGFGIRREEEVAAVKIQSNFRAYLSRRALKALKALVKLQALVKGYLVRKHAAYQLRCLQAIIRAQARSRIGWSQISDSPHSSSKSSHFHHPGPPTPKKFEHPLRSSSTKHQPSLLKRNGSKSYARADSKIKGPKADEQGDKILEVDPGKLHMTPGRRNLFQSSHSHSHSHSFTTSRDSTMHQTAPSPSSGEVNCFSPLIFTNDNEEMSFFTAENIPQFYSASSKGNSSMRGPFTPSKSDGSRSCLSGYSDHPNYMSYTESSRAKVRSLSAPRQRTQFEISGLTKRHSVYGYGDSSRQRVSALHANFASKAYPGSGRLDRLGMPVGGDVAGYSGGFWNRY